MSGGWPDFAVLDRDGNLLAFVEVKSGTDTLSRRQRVMHAILESAGYPVRVLRPEQFPKFKREIAAMAKRNRDIPPERPLNPLGVLRPLPGEIER